MHSCISKRVWIWLCTYGMIFCSAWLSLHLHKHHLCLTRPPSVRLYFQRRSTEQLKCESHLFWAIQGNESRRKVTESHTSYPTGSFKGRTKGLPPSFLINLYALPHTGSTATSAAHVTYLIWLWGLLLMEDGDIKWEGGFYPGCRPWQIKSGCWYLSSFTNTKWV